MLIHWKIQYFYSKVQHTAICNNTYTSHRFNVGQKTDNRVHTELLHFYQGQEQAKLICDDRGENKQLSLGDTDWQRA